MGIWVEPPKQHDEYIFFARPLNDRCTNQSNTMKREKLRQWYVHMLDKGQERKIVESVGSLCDAFADIKSAREIPLFKGDQWEFTLAELIDGKRKGESKRAVLTRKDSIQLVTGVKEAMKDNKDQFLVAKLFKPKSVKKRVEEPIITSLFTNSREAFHSECTRQHWQFNNLRFAKYSTMMLTHFFVSQPKPTYCIAGCKRGRIDDGYGMVGCDSCENWYHMECVNVSQDAAEQDDFDYVCPLCAEKHQL